MDSEKNRNTMGEKTKKPDAASENPSGRRAAGSTTDVDIAETKRRISLDELAGVSRKPRTDSTGRDVNASPATASREREGARQTVADDGEKTAAPSQARARTRAPYGLVELDPDADYFLPDDSSTLKKYVMPNLPVRRKRPASQPAAPQAKAPTRQPEAAKKNAAEARRDIDKLIEQIAEANEKISAEPKTAKASVNNAATDSGKKPESKRDIDKLIEQIVATKEETATEPQAAKTSGNNAATDSGKKPESSADVDTPTEQATAKEVSSEPEAEKASGNNVATDNGKKPESSADVDKPAEQAAAKEETSSEPEAAKISGDNAATDSSKKPESSAVVDKPTEQAVAKEETSSEPEAAKATGNDGDSETTDAAAQETAKPADAEKGKGGRKAKKEAKKAAKKASTDEAQSAAEPAASAGEETEKADNEAEKAQTDDDSDSLYDEEYERLYQKYYSKRTVGEVLWKDRKKRTRVAFIVVIIIAALAVAVTFYVTKKLNLIDFSHDDVTTPSTTLYPEEVIYDDKDFAMMTAIDDASSLKDYLYRWSFTGDGQEDELMKSKNVINVLVLGLDSDDALENGGRSDTNIIISLNRKTKRINLTSIYRDSWVYMNVDGRDRYTKLNAAYFYGGPQGIVDTIEKNLKIDIDFYAAVDYSSFVDIIQALGGITVEVQEYEAKYINRTTVHEIDFGPAVELDGYEALVFARIRKSDSDSDISRTRRQRQVIVALMTELRKASLSEINAAINALFKYVKTDITKSQLVSYATQAVLYKWIDYQITETVLSTEDVLKTGYIGEASAVFMDFPLAAYRIQNDVYGKSNIILAEDRDTIFNYMD